MNANTLSWPPHLVVATVVEREGRYLFVEERINGRLVLNQPAGHWEPGESLFEAARRETLEESAWQVELTGFLGIYQHEPAGLGYGFMRFAFLAQARQHEPQRTLDAGIERAVWLDRDELVGAAGRHRSPMVLRCVDDAIAGQRYPLELIHSLASS